MSKLVEMLSTNKTQKPPTVGKRSSVFKESVSRDDDSYSKSGYHISEENLEKIRASVYELNEKAMELFSREQIIVGMYGGIKNPETGDKFNIPYLTYTDKDYAFKYADMMRLLVQDPESFEKVMNWE